MIKEFHYQGEMLR